MYILDISYQLPLLSLILPGWNWYPFRKILKYSLAIFAMGIFQMTANNLRPLLLGRFSRDGVEVLTDYRVIQTIAMLVIAIGGVFMQVLLPSTSKHYADGNQRKLDEIVYDGTKYITLLLSLIVFILCLKKLQSVGPRDGFKPNRTAVRARRHHEAG